MSKIEKVILFNDIIGSSKLWRLYDIKMYNKLNKFIEITNNLLKNYNNSKIIKMLGDSFMLEFNKVEDAINFSIELNNILNNNKTGLFLNKSKNDRILIRTGICYGKVHKLNFNIQNCNVIDYFGNVVNTTSRMESKVAKNNGIAIGFLKDKEKDINKIYNTFKNNDKYNVKLLDYNNNSSINRNKRSAKLLNNLNFVCKNIQKLKGVDNIKVIDISPK